MLQQIPSIGGKIDCNLIKSSPLRSIIHNGKTRSARDLCNGASIVRGSLGGQGHGKIRTTRKSKVKGNIYGWIRLRTKVHTRRCVGRREGGGKDKKKKKKHLGLWVMWPYSPSLLHPSHPYQPNSCIHKWVYINKISHFPAAPLQFESFENLDLKTDWMQTERECNGASIRRSSLRGHHMLTNPTVAYIKWAHIHKMSHYPATPLQGDIKG